MDKVINFGIPHVAEQIFEYVNVAALLQSRLVSKTWKEIAESVVLKRWRETFVTACQIGHIDVVEQIIESSEWQTIDLNITDDHGKTGFMLACQEGRVNVIKLLLNQNLSSPN